MAGQVWPELISENLAFRLGERPVFDYVRMNAEESSDQTAITFQGAKISYRLLQKQADAFASFLLKRGLKKGDRVALYLPNCPQFVIALFGAQKAGAIVSPCNPMFKEWELQYQLKDMQPRVIVLLNAFYDRFLNIGDTGIDTVIMTGISDFAGIPAQRALPSGVIDFYETTLTDEEESLIPDVQMEDFCLMIYTSGTTGLPKGVMLTHRNLLFKAACAATVYGFQKDDVFLSVMPIYHVAGLLAGISVPIYVGAQLVLLPQFEPELAMEAIDQNHCTIAYTVTPMNVAIMAQPKQEAYNLTSLRLNMCSSFGISITEELSDRWGKLTGGCKLFESSFGMSETCGFDTFMPLSKIKFGTVGIPVYECQINIVDQETGSEAMPVGQSGEILIRNPGVFREYWNRPEETAEALKDGWLHTGDMGKLDEDGYLVFLGRKKEMIKSSGYSVFPEEVELYLLKHPAIRAAAVIGLPDPQRGEVVKAFVVLRPEFTGRVTEDEIIQWAKEKISNYKCPRLVEFRSELPASGTGKVLRRLLAAEVPK